MFKAVISASDRLLVQVFSRLPPHSTSSFLLIVSCLTAEGFRVIFLSCLLFLLSSVPVFSSFFLPMSSCLNPLTPLPKAASVSSGRGPLTSHPPLRLLAGGGERQEKAAQPVEGGLRHAAAWGQLSATHCFVIVPMAFRPR